MKTKALLGVIVLVVMSVVIAYLVMQRDQPNTTDPGSDAVVAIAPRPAPFYMAPKHHTQRQLLKT